MIGVEFVKDPLTRDPDVAFRDEVEQLAFERGLLTLGCGKSTIRISPPLCLTQAEAEEGLEIFEEAISVAENELGVQDQRQEVSVDIK
jgi:4-aminobutyrate aminotransferase